MRIKLIRTDDGYTTPTGRFVVHQVYRAARRGPNSRVADGWDLADELTGTNRHYPTLADVRVIIQGVLDQERRVANTETWLYWTATDRYRSYGLTEVWVHTSVELHAGRSASAMLGLFYATTEPLFVARVEATLARLGIHPERWVP